MYQEEEKEIYAAEFLYREVGCYMLNKQFYKRSLPHFDKAVEITPKDFRTLYGRSDARAKCAYFKCALSDIKACLNAYPGDLRAEQQRATYTFLNTDFEDAFVLNQRGISKRKQPDTFLIGTMQCAEEVERTIGKRGGHPLRDHYSMIRIIAWKKAIDLRKGPQWKPSCKKRKRKPKKTDNTPLLYTKYIKKITHQQSDHRSDLSILESLTEDRTLEFLSLIPKMKTDYFPQQKRTTNIDNLMAEKYLDKMCYDKKFLKELKSDPRIYCPNYDGSIKIKVLARKGYKSVGLRQEILRVRQPFYSIKYNEVESQGALLLRQMEALHILQDVARNDVEHYIKLLRFSREAYQTNKCIKIADKLKTYIDKKPLKILPTKESYLKLLYDLIGLVHLDCFRLAEGMTEDDKEKRINFLFGLPISREPSTDSVIRENKKEFEDVRKRITETEIRMAKATSPLETVWLFFELARFHVPLKKWDLCRFYARKALNMARILKNTVWCTNVMMLITKSLVLQRNRNEAKNELKRTREIALQLKYEDIITFIDRSLQIVEQIDFEDVSIDKVIREREKQIVRAIIKVAMQEEIRHLFELMDAIPGYRRLPIMPGVNLEERSSPSRKMNAIKPSIKPHSAIDLEFQAQFAKKGMELLEVD